MIQINLLIVIYLLYEIKITGQAREGLAEKKVDISEKNSCILAILLLSTYCM